MPPTKVTPEFIPNQKNTLWALFLARGSYIQK
nr:MAG TPA: hypothetical protein [Caudoviricetes sp.]